MKAESPIVKTAPQPEPSPEAHSGPEHAVPAPEVAAPTGKSRRKQASPPAASVPAQPAAKAPAVPQATPSPKPPSPIAPAESKSAWTVEEEKKPLSLREIQELELKKADARKSAERERERAARAAAVSTPSVPEDVQTISWGLPTSQVGNRTSREAPVSSSTNTTAPGTSATPPVWTNVAKAPAVKKTMKEIQEEEEKRKK